MIILDTTVLAYAVGEEHPLRNPCRRLLAAHAEGRIEATTTVAVIQEFAHIRARWRTRPEAIHLARRYMAAFTLVITTADDLDRGLDLFGRYPMIGAFDAVLAAVALARRADAMVSADRAFASVPGLPFVDPTTPDLVRLIGD